MKPKCPKFNEIYSPKVLDNMKSLGIEMTTDYRGKNDVVFGTMVDFAKKNKKLARFDDLVKLTKMTRRDICEITSKLYGAGRLHRISRGIYVPIVNKS